MAIGARTADVFRLVLAHTVRLAAIGAAAGLLFALAATRLIANRLYGVSPRDPATFAAVTALLVAVALAASYAPRGGRPGWIQSWCCAMNELK